MRGASRCSLIGVPGCFPSVLPDPSWAARGGRWASLRPTAALPEPPFSRGEVAGETPPPCGAAG